jgi:hypothetical protein
MDGSTPPTRVFIIKYCVVNPGIINEEKIMSFYDFSTRMTRYLFTAYL